ncbi:hypothetical protein ACWC4A_49695 [Streptomyces mirabilis]
MSESEVPRRSAPDDNINELELPLAPARWDDPPNSLSEQELMRMAPGGQDDELLTAVSDAVWEPAELNETPSVRAERLKRITEQGEKLRERWAETAALEEAYAAPSPTLQERQRSAQAHKKELIQDRMRRRKRRQLVLAGAGGSSSILMAVLGVFVVSHGPLDEWGTSAALTVISANIGALLTTTLGFFWSEARDRVHVRVSKRRHPHKDDGSRTEEAPMTTPE